MTTWMRYVMPQDLKSFGLIPELIGRIPVLTYLEPSTGLRCASILTEPKNAITRQYVELFEMDGIKLTFDEDALDYIVDKAIEYKLGARGLRSICEAIMMDGMFDLPGQEGCVPPCAFWFRRESRLESDKFRQLKAVG